jgi:single-strand DNA-binding protein
MNRVILIGTVDKDPEIRSTGTGSEVANFTLAVTETYESQGQSKSRTEWARCVAWGHLVDLVRSRVARGDPLLVEGRMQTRKWEDRNGGTRYVTEVTATRVVLLSGSAADAAYASASSSSAPTSGADPTQDEIPF